MPGLVPGIHADPTPQTLTASCSSAAWMAGTSPAKTRWGCGETNALAIRSHFSFPGQPPEVAGSLFRFESKDRIGGAVAGFYPLSANKKELKMREIIRFAWGISSLGDFMAAMSGKGLVALEFGSRRSATEDGLRARFPEADVINAQEELADTMEKLGRAIEEPGFDPGAPLDLRGTPYELQVWSMLRAIPMGETTSYGALAAHLGSRDARKATEAIASNPVAVLIPCHRVIKKDGSISGYRWGVKRKRELLAREQRTAGVTGA
jgi:AraC family transcriptional regulator of adaptative response/methylated-DNA-[protein]-cysteine methyltransferase